MEVETRIVKLSEIKPNPQNPRTISNMKMKSLVKSLQEFPEMLDLREIVVDETMTILGGNMRMLALQKVGAEECTAKIVTGLSEKQKKEFIIKDNVPLGKWDFNMLVDVWDDMPLVDWGVDMPKLDDIELPAEGGGEEKEHMTECPKCGFTYAI